MQDMTQLAPNVFVGPQIEPQDIALLAGDGFTDVICNRPDEEHPGGPVSGIMARAAVEHGIRFHYLPITHGEPMEPQAQALRRLIAKPGSRTFAYCRSGARSTGCWQIARTLHTGHANRES